VSAATDSLLIRKEVDRKGLINGPITIFAHQLHGGIGHGIRCCQQHGIGGMLVPAGDAVRLVAEQGCDGRLAVPEISGKTGEAVAQHMRRDIGRQITQLGDPQPHLPIADDGRLAGSTGEHHIADPRL
jgi:hypothetical protein